MLRSVFVAIFLQLMNRIHSYQSSLVRLAGRVHGNKSMDTALYQRGNCLKSHMLKPRSISSFAIPNLQNTVLSYPSFLGLRGGKNSHFMGSALRGSFHTDATPAVKEYFRADYKPPAYSTKKIFLDFQLENERTVVTTTNRILVVNPQEDLILNGEELHLEHVSVNDKELSSLQYKIEDDKLIIPSHVLQNEIDNHNFITLKTIVTINPAKNLALSGLYKSGGEKSSLLCTQCEAMGFRRITYSFDRPDVLAIYKVRLEADATKFPILLSNGNLLQSGEIPSTTESTSKRHWVLWEDPFPKPSYLFALVAGDLASVQDTFITKSGRKVQLGIYSDKENVDKLDHAMYSLKESMKWDEETFNLECDLDVYNIVATNDFNMGAM
jgi:aminopeptidase N